MSKFSISLQPRVTCSLVSPLLCPFQVRSLTCAHAVFVAWRVSHLRVCQRTPTDGQQVPTKMLVITHQGDGHHHHTVLSPHTRRNGGHKEARRQPVLVRVGNSVLPTEVSVVHPPAKTVWSFLKKLKPELPYDRAFSLLGLYPNKIDLEDTPVFPSSFLELFSTGSVRKQPV